MSLLAVFLSIPLWAGNAKEGRIRIFVTDSKSWEVSGGFAGDNGNIAGRTSGGARPQTAEIMKTFRKRCPAVTVTIREDRADYIVILDHEGGKSLIQRDNKVAVFDGEGDMIYAHSTRSLGNAVKDACKAIAQDLN